MNEPRRYTWDELATWRWGPAAGKPLPPPPPPRTGPRELGDDDDLETSPEWLAEFNERIGR